MSLFNSQTWNNARSEELDLNGFQPLGHFWISLIDYCDEMPSCPFEQSIKSFDTKIVIEKHSKLQPYVFCLTSNHNKERHHQ